MFCPICGVEHREGFTWCSQCHASLVDEPPEKEAPESDNLSSIFEGDAGSATVVRAMLEGAGIEAWIKDEEEHGVLPNLGPIEVLVHEANRKAALEVLEMPRHDPAANYDDSHVSSREARSDAFVRKTAGLRDLRKDRNNTGRGRNETRGKGHQGKNQRRQSKRI